LESGSARGQNRFLVPYFARFAKKNALAPYRPWEAAQQWPASTSGAGAAKKDSGEDPPALFHSGDARSLVLPRVNN